MDPKLLEFISTVLQPGIGTELTNQLLSNDISKRYFLTAFTHKTFAFSKASKKEKFDYEVFEKLGDRILAAAFTKWLVDIMYDEIKIPSLYSDMEKIFTAKEFLAELTEHLGFDRWIRTVDGVGNNIDMDMKEDVFEAFIGAISMAGDIIVEDFGFCLAKRWIYQVYNTHVRSRIDPRNPASYVDYRTQINEIWSFNTWGNQLYITTGESSKLGDLSISTVDLKAPITPNFPANFRGKTLGTGQGRTIAEAKEAAAEDALKKLKVEYSELKNSEVVFDKLGNARLSKLFEQHPQVLKRLLKVMNDKSHIYRNASFRRAKVGHIFMVQLRVEIEGVMKNSERGRDKDKTRAVIIATEKFIKNASKPIKLNV